MEAIRICLSKFLRGAKSRRFCVLFCAHWPEVSATFPTKDWSFRLHLAFRFQIFDGLENRTGVEFARNWGDAISILLAPLDKFRCLLRASPRLWS